MFFQFHSFKLKFLRLWEIWSQTKKLTNSRYLLSNGVYNSMMDIFLGLAAFAVLVEKICTFFFWISGSRNVKIWVGDYYWKGCLQPKPYSYRIEIVNMSRHGTIRMKVSTCRPSAVPLVHLWPRRTGTWSCVFLSGKQVGHVFGGLCECVWSQRTVYIFNLRKQSWRNVWGDWASGLRKSMIFEQCKKTWRRFV